MRLHLDRISAGESKDLFQPADWMERPQRKEKICDGMPAGQHAVLPVAVRAVQKALFAANEREVPSHHDAVRQQLGELNVLAQMHVMMAIHPICGMSENPLEFIHLRLNNGMERRGKAGMKEHGRQAMSPEKPRASPLMLHEPCRA